MKQIRLIELFSGIGAQAKALENLGIPFESWKTCDWEVHAMESYNAIHNTHTGGVELESASFTFEEIACFLYSLGISNDGKKAMSLDQIKRKGEKWCRKIYNIIKQTKNLVNIATATGKELDIVDTDKYTYIMSYSFPCTSLSLAGKQEGMVEGSETSSSLLWEVKRILNECNDLNALPQVLLMENVTQVHNKKNMPEFQKWLDFLESIGYKNYWQDLNAKDFGVPQNRNRCFMVSILGDFDYEFPEPIPLTNAMKDYLEDSVDEKYYIKNERADLLIEKLILNGTLPRESALIYQ